MKSISSFMLIGMLFAISSVNASPSRDKCINAKFHCRNKDDHEKALWACTCAIWIMNGKGDCNKGCMADYPNQDAKDYCSEHCPQRKIILDAFGTPLFRLTERWCRGSPLTRALTLLSSISPRCDEVGSGKNNGFDFGDALGTFRGDDKGFHKSSGGDHFRKDDNKGGNNHGKGHGGRDRVAEKKHMALKAAANEEKKKAVAVKAAAEFNAAAANEDSHHKEADLKKFKKEKSGGRGGFEGGRYGGFEGSVGSVGSLTGSSSTSGFQSGSFLGARSFDGEKCGSGLHQKKEKVKKVGAHLKNE
ncbi:hypothetical protein CF336_g8212 [Tilletia laevis]|nr:hypothetical protein CF336_g8212 [Tilletia laevis]